MKARSGIDCKRFDVMSSIVKCEHFLLTFFFVEFSTTFVSAFSLSEN